MLNSRWLLLVALCCGSGCVRASEAGVSPANDISVDAAGGDGVADGPAVDFMPWGDGWLQDWGGSVPAWCTCDKVDFNGDGFVDAADFGKYFSPCFGHAGTGACASSDFDGDGQVTVFDFQCFLTFFSGATPSCGT